MIERLAIPSWNAKSATLEDWIRTLSDLGHAPTCSRDDGMTWIELPSLRLRGFVVSEGQNVEAINFELHEPENAPVLMLLESAATLLWWEIHEADDDEPEDS
jgi:hypothetical protein